MVAMRFKSAADTVEDREERNAERAAEIHGDGAMDLTDTDQYSTALVSKIRKAWYRNRGDKTRVEKILLNCLRARTGEYSPSKLAEIRQAGGSEIYVKATTGKVRTGIAHTKAVMMPTGGWSHGIKPTKNPKLPKWMVEEAALYLAKNPMFEDENGQPVQMEDQARQLEHMIRVQLAERAKYAAKRMEAKIYDQLQEGGYREALSDFIDDLFTFTAAFMKGPFFVNKPRLTYQMGRSGLYEPQRTIEPVMQFRTINPLDAYPAPGVDSVHKGDFIERLRLSRDDLYAMRETPEVYDKEAIDRVLMQGTSSSMVDWLWTDSQRQSIAEHTYFWYASTSEFDGLHWYGEAMGFELIEHGVPSSKVDPVRNYQVDAILIGNEIIKATLNTDPLYRRNVNSTSYEKIPGAVFGNTVATLMDDTAAMINGTARSLQNNLAHASGFQVSVDYTRLSDETDAMDIYPFKVWQGRESEFSGTRPVVEFFQPTSNAQELIGVMREFMEQADRDTGIPAFLSGGGGEGGSATAKAAQMLKDDSAKLLRSAFINVDEDVISKLLHYMYDYNMLYDEDPSIKGDCQIVAKGMHAALQREGAQQQHMAILDLLGNDYDRQLIGDERRYSIIRNLLDTFEEIDTDEIIPSDEEIKNRLKEMAAVQPPPDPKLIKIEQDGVIAQQRMQLEQQKMAQDEKFNREKLAAEIQRNIRDNETRVQVSRDDLDLKMQNEIIKLRAARHSAFEMGSQATAIERMKLEAKAKQQMQELRNSLTLQKAQAKAAPTDTPVEPAMSSEQIRSEVESAIMPLVTEFKADTMKIIDGLTAMMKEDSGEREGNEINVHVNMESCKPGSKKITTTRDADGNLQAMVTPQGEDE